MRVTERRQLLNALDRLPEGDDEVVLATVVKVEGSAYRRPGARMLIPRFGGAVGTLSGGCLESEVSKKAWWLTEGGKAVVCRYSTASQSVDGETVDEDAELSFGLGCNGTVYVLLERLRRDAPIFALLRAVEQGRQPAARAVVIGKHPNHADNVGDNVCIGVETPLSSALSEPSLLALLQAELAEVLSAGESRLLQLADPLATLELLLEFLPPPPDLLIVGAGHDAEPLCRLAAQLGWRVTVLDGRRHFARAERFPDAVSVLCLQPNDQAVAQLPAQAAVVIMTHSFSQDRAWLRHFLRCSPPYLGQLGPKSRTMRLLDEPASSEEPVCQEALARLHAPIGLDLGGSTPETIALAILAEAQAALNGRDGGKLRQRIAAIHVAEPVRRLALPADALVTAMAQRAAES